MARSVPTWTSPLKVGVLTLIAGAMAAGYILFVGDNPLSGGPSRRVTIVFDSARGLVPKSRVLVSGLEVGRIADIRLTNDGGPARARIFVDLRADLQLYADASARKVAESLLGTALVEIFPGHPESGPLPEGAEITRIRSGEGLDDLVQSTLPITDDIKAVTAGVRKLVEGTADREGKLVLIMTHLANITERLDRRMEGQLDDVDATLKGARRAVGHAEKVSKTAETIAADSKGEIRAILAEIRKLTESVNAQVGRTGPGVERSVGALERTLVQVERLLARLDRTAGYIEGTAEGVAEGKGTAGRLLTDDTLVNDVEDSAARLSDFIGGIDRLRPVFHVESNYYGQGALKNYVMLRLYPNPYKYLVFGFVDDPRLSTEWTRTIIHTTDSTRDPWVREEKSVTTRKLKFTVQYAHGFPITWWFYPVARFGIRENYGGVGLDFHLFSDWVRIQNDFFDFAPQARPRFRSALQVDLWRRIYITGGGDDLLNPTRDWFVGAGILFGDDDIKGILPFSGSAVQR